MRIARLVTALTLGTMAVATGVRVTRAEGPGSGGVEPVTATEAGKRLTPVVGYPVAFTISKAVRDLPAAPAREIHPDADLREIRNPSLAAARSRRPPLKRVSRLSQTGDQALASTPAPTPMDPPVLTFEGLNNLQSAGLVGFFLTPPDTNGDVGPNHYVQTVNLAVRVWNRSGVPLTPPFLMSTLFTGGGPCAVDDGDPIVLYDQLANRWILSQFAFPSFPNGPFYQCFAISQTADPTGAYYAYTFQMPVSPAGHNLNDYPKFGVWPDAYYMTDNQFLAPGLSFHGAGAFAFDRLKLLAGDPAANFVYFDLEPLDPFIGGLLPSDLDGPSRVRPNILAFFTATEFGDPGGDGLRMFEFVPNFTTPASSTFTELPFLPVAAFDPVTPAGSDIPQPGTAVRLDSLGDRLMHRLQYRNYVTHESLVVSHTVDASGDPSAAVYRAGVRYYELRRTLPSGTWTVREQATYAPAGTIHRWMPSAAMDNDGNLAVGFSVSDGTSVFPGIRYAGRLAADPTGLAQGEALLQAGTGVQTGSNRWGDYSMLAVDPVDDCTFWFTTQYHTPAPGPGCTGGGATICWQTRVGTFRFASCTPPPAAGTITGTVTDAVTTAPIPGATVTATGGYAAITNASGVYNASVPAGTYDVTASKAGYTSATATGQVVTAGGTTTVNLALSPSNAVRYFPVTPCRLVDTRSGAPLAAGSTTNFTVAGASCTIPANAAAVAINVTVAQQTDFGNLRVYPNGQAEPIASTINFVVGRTRANNAIVPVGTSGQLRVKVDMPPGSTGATHVILDVYGYFR